MIIEVLNILKDFSPAGAVALSLVIIIMLLKQRSTASNIGLKNDRGEEISLPKLDEKITILTENHMHQVNEQLTKIAISTERIERLLVSMNDNVTYIKARTNGKG